MYRYYRDYLHRTGGSCSPRKKTDPSFDVSQLADQLQISKAHLNRKLTAQIGFSPAKLILYHRMELAKECLTLSTDSIIEIADQCGFGGVPSFSRKFKQEFGLTPSQYRKNIFKDQLKPLVWQLPVNEALFNQLIILKSRHVWLADFFIHTIDNFHNELFTIEQLSNSLFMSSVTLNRKIKQLFGIPTRRLVLDLRLQYAAEILTEQNKTVTETAFLAGFFDAAHLTRHFKQVFGCSPNRYKRIKMSFFLIDKFKIYK